MPITAGALRRKKLLLLGLPVSLLAEKPGSIAAFHRILRFMVEHDCPAYHSQPAEDYEFFRVEGWMSLAAAGIRPRNIGHLWMARGHRDSAPIVEFIAARVRRSTTPVVLIRPGNPRIGDHPALMLTRLFGDAAYLFAPRSAIDLVGDLAERISGLRHPRREYHSAQDLLERGAADVGRGLVLIHCTAPTYLDGNERVLALIAKRLCESGHRRRIAFLKSPLTFGDFCTVDDLRRSDGKIDPHLHYTIALLPKP